MNAPDMISGEMIAATEIEDAVAWRRHLHRHPELAFQEHETARFVAGRLAEWGLAVHRGHGGTGVVGTLSRGTSRRTIALRADMDALAMQEETGLAHQSSTPGRMHACGHDGHTAMLLAAACAVARLPNLDGTVHFVFQPAEENEGGGRRMVEDGLFRDFPSDAIYGLHNWPALAAGACVARDDAMMAAFGTFEIAVRGRGAHGGMPHEGTDPIPAACAIVSALQTIVGRNVSPMESAVVSATQIHAGDTWNVIPEHCVIRGTTRWFADTVGDLIERRMRAVAAAIADGFGCTATTNYVRRYPAVINDPAAAALVRSVASDPALGLAVEDAAPSMGSDDFAFMLNEVPGCYFWLGAARDGENPRLHSPRYDFNDAILPRGMALWTRLVQRTLAA